MVRSERVPQRGDAVWIDFSPQMGSEQAGRRPAVVLSPEAYNGRVGLALVCPITSQLMGYPFEVAIPSGLNVRGGILADQVKSLDWQARNAKILAPLPAETIDEVLEKIGVLLSRDER